MKNFVFKAALVIVIVIFTYQLGVKPWFRQLDGEGSRNWAEGKLTHEEGRYDVIVIGEDPEGIAAAVSSARLGANTLLIAQGKDLGGIVTQGLVADLEVGRDDTGEIVNKGIFSELHGKLGDNYSMDRYLTVVTRMVKNEKKLEVVYNAKVDSVSGPKNSITAVNVLVGGKIRPYYGKMYIDATREGTVLKMCGVPYFTGSEDLNLKKLYMPVRLNFELGDMDWNKLDTLVNSTTGKFASVMKKYTATDVNIRVNNIRFFNQGSGRVIVQGIEVLNLDVSDEKAVGKAYYKAKDEVRNLVAFLMTGFNEFKGVKSYRVADRFYIRESNHFIGEASLGVNDVLENRDSSDKIALGANPVDAGKFANSDSYIVGKPSKYAVPLGCIIPLKTDNLLMVGSKISYSSLASTSSGALSIGITTGESAGAAAVFSLVNNMTLSDMLIQRDTEKILELEELLKKQGVYLPDIKVKNRNAENWAYPAVRELDSLGLLAGGMSNNYAFKSDATRKDVVTILLNGVYRLSEEKYSIELDMRLRPYLKAEKITPETMGEMLLALYGEEAPEGQAFSRACQKGYIDEIAQFQMSKKKYLTMEDVYNLCANNLIKYTGKQING